MKPVSENNNFIYLTIGIVLLLFVGAIVDQFPGLKGHQLVQAFSAVNIAIGIYGFKRSSLFFRTGLGLLALTVSIVLVGEFMEELKLFYLHLVVLFCFYLWSTWLASKQVLFGGNIDANRIVGAICIYLLMGLVWAMMYLFIAQAVPGAFNGIAQEVWYHNFADLAYYSFVTLTTLGYGDISPVAPIAKFLVYMEAVFGVFYMAILVASLVGIGINQAQKKHE
jgi:hypothetical protein